MNAADRAVLEVAANSIASVLAAEAGGADRVELCSALEVGGLTPSYALIAMACERLSIPIHVLIRPRAGDFVYDEAELEVMRRDVATCRALGCAGVVIGALTADGKVDVAGCRRVLEAAGGMSVTFHRAFDFVRDPTSALKSVIDLGCARLLTSGQADCALAGASLIRQLIVGAATDVIIMPGGGIAVSNISVVARETGASEFHASAKARVTGRMHGTPGHMGELSAEHWQTDVDAVSALVVALRRLMLPARALDADP